jgi:hypothetical protein
MIFSFSIGLCVDNDVDINNGNCVTDAVFEPAPIEISGNFKQLQSQFEGLAVFKRLLRILV